jgi:hypothetical protein
VGAAVYKRACALQFQTNPKTKQTKPTVQRKIRLNRMAVYNNITSKTMRQMIFAKSMKNFAQNFARDLPAGRTPGTEQRVNSGGAAVELSKFSNYFDKPLDKVPDLLYHFLKYRYDKGGLSWKIHSRAGSKKHFQDSAARAFPHCRASRAYTIRVLSTTPAA